MTADTVQARYEQLDQVATRFAKASASSAELQRSIARCVEVLERGGWQGRGADAFFAEMHGTMYPAMQRLIKALDQGRATTLQVKEILRAAEEEAAKPFRNQSQGFANNQDGSAPNAGFTAPFSVPGHAGAVGFQASVSGPRGNSAFGSGSKREGEFKVVDWKNGDQNPHYPRELGFKYGVIEGSAASAKAGGNFTLGSIGAAAGVSGTLGAYEAGAKFGGGKDGFTAGAYGEVSAAKAQAEFVAGDEDFGFTKSYEVKAGSAEAFIGMKNNTIGAEAGFTLASIKEETGVNVAGVNVGVSGEVGFKWEVGFRIGPKNLEAKLPFISVGFSIGKAKTGH